MMFHHTTSASISKLASTFERMRCSRLKHGFETILFRHTVRRKGRNKEQQIDDYVRYQYSKVRSCMRKAWAKRAGTSGTT